MMATRKATRWIAERALVDDTGKQLKAAVGIPEKVSKLEWRCPYRLSRGRAGEIRYAHGVDSIQALILALGSIRLAIDKLEIAVKWDIAAEMGDSGFPIFIQQIFGLEFTRSLERMVSTETERYALAITKRKKS
jgi:hypothetical protein